MKNNKVCKEVIFFGKSINEYQNMIGDLKKVYRRGHNKREEKEKKSSQQKLKDKIRS